MSLQNKNFLVDERVKFILTSDTKLDSQKGTVLGKSIEGLCDFYIVLLDAPYFGQKAITITEACLERI